MLIINWINLNIDEKKKILQTLKRGKKDICDFGEMSSGCLKLHNLFNFFFIVSVSSSSFLSSSTVFNSFINAKMPLSILILDALFL